MSEECMITTIDNPYDPFEQFDLWFMFDIEKGYYTYSKIARLSNVTFDMAPFEFDRETDRAIDKLIEIDFANIYRKVYKKQGKQVQHTT